ncbi:hypothetical protein LXA43DRAFT_1067237 [Ganoderma leucocontextum]|nr:hypothetical protein LXA43DRAFT_1067237 [Ganoderma leucocontextum]
MSNTRVGAQKSDRWEWEMNTNIAPPIQFSTTPGDDDSDDDYPGSVRVNSERQHDPSQEPASRSDLVDSILPGNESDDSNDSVFLVPIAAPTFGRRVPKTTDSEEDIPDHGDRYTPRDPEMTDDQSDDDFYDGRFPLLYSLGVHSLHITPMATAQDNDMSVIRGSASLVPDDPMDVDWSDEEMEGPIAPPVRLRMYTTTIEHPENENAGPSDLDRTLERHVTIPEPHVPRPAPSEDENTTRYDDNDTNHVQQTTERGEYEPLLCALSSEAMTKYRSAVVEAAQSDVLRGLWEKAQK